jgi:hypothetical protein
MRRFPTTLFILVLTAVAAVAGWRLFAHPVAERSAAVRRVLASKSYIRVEMHVVYQSGRVGSENYVLVDDDGVSKASYAATDPQTGTTARFSEQSRGYDVSFLFEKLVQDGIWQLTSKPPRAANEPIYTVAVTQTIQGQHGSRHVTFSDPAYWARAREFHLTLNKKARTPSIDDVVRMESTANPDPRYLEVVNDFRSFGSPRFKATVAAARRRLLRS